MNLLKNVQGLLVEDELTATGRCDSKPCRGVGRLATVPEDIQRQPGISVMPHKVDDRQNLTAIDKTEADIEARIVARDEARRSKDYAASDAIRKELDALGVILMDGSQGTLWRMRVE